MKITQVNNRFFVETAEGRLHVLNEKALRWNLKKVFGLSAPTVAEIVYKLSTNGTVTVTLAA